MGKEGKAARRRLRGNLRTHALGNSTSGCTQTRKFRRGNPIIVSPAGARVPKVEAILHDGISDYCRCALRKDRVLFPESFVRAFPEKRSYRSTI